MSSRTPEGGRGLGDRARRFVGELRRRRVVRAFVAYVVVGFTLAEGADIFFPGLGMPEWSTRLVVVLITLGLPVTLGLAWYFDVVPETARHGKRPEASGSTSVDQASSASGPPPAPTPSATGSHPSPATDPAALWTAARDLFHKALEIDEADRERFLRRAAGGDDALLREVRSLLAAHEGPGPLDQLQERVQKAVVSASPSVEGLEGTTVRQYEVLERLGGGAMGVVYRARDRRLARSVTLKFLSGHLLSSPEAKERFLVEARAAAALDHPNLCTIHEIGETDGGLLFIAMAYYGGETLKRRIGRGTMAVAEALDVATQMAQGLAAAADHGVIHRDVKPANVILTDEGTVKIVDFGLAKRAGAALTLTGARVGTPLYMSPEQTRGQTVDQRTDIWSVGVVLYEMLTGRRPFRGGSEQAIVHAILNDEVVPPTELVPGLPQGIDRVVLRALEKDPARRHPDARSLVAELQGLLGDPDRFASADRASGLPPEGERRLVTVLVLDLKGVDQLLETAESEVVDLSLARLRGRLQRTVEEYGGVLNDFTEERAVALFGVPVAHEDDALRAARAALELRDPPPDSEGIELCGALGSGQTVVRPMDDPAHPFRLGGGLAREVSRLAARAEPGEILVTPELGRHIGPFIDTRERTDLEPIGEGSGSYPGLVVGETEADSRLEASLPGGLTPFVGRRDELDTLLRALQAANVSGGRVVSIVGDAGVGKSRLLHEFRTVLAEDSVRYVQGRCQANSALTPFVPFIECVQALLGLNRVPSDQIHDQVVARTRALDPQLEPYVPLLLHLLSIESEVHPLPAYLTGEDLRAGIAEALVSFFTLGSRGQPLVVFLEDWHWADSGSDDVMTLLTEMVSDYPLLAVVTSRPPSAGYRPPFRGQVNLDLPPLEPASAVEVMRSALRARASSELAALVSEKTGGNPFFIEELCHTLMEQGTVEVEGGEARLRSSVGRVAIPDTVQAVLKTRLDRLDPEAREVIRTASVIGRTFGMELLKRVVPSAARVQGALEALRASGLIHRTSLVPEPRYRFKHALTQDVAYESLLARQRQERHLLVGEALESLESERLDEIADVLAGHFGEAEEWDRAIRYGITAAERAAFLWRLDEAVASLSRVREWVQRREGDPAERDALLVELLLQEERHLETLGRRDAQRQALDEVLALLPEGRASAPEAMAWVRRGELATLRGDDQAATEAFQRAVEVAEACGADEARVMALRGIGHRFWRMGQYEQAVGPLSEVVQYDRADASGTRLLRDLINLGRVLRELGRFDDALAIGEEAGAMARGSGNHVDAIYAANYLGHLYRAMDRPQDALREFKRGSAIGREAHLPVRLAFNLLAEAALYMDMGRLDDSLETYRETVETGRRTGRPDHLAASLSLYADALVTVGRPGEAVPLLEEASQILGSLATDGALEEALVKLATAREQAGLPGVAEAWTDVRSVRDRLGDRSGVLEALEHEIRLRRGDPGALLERSEEALALAREIEDAAAEARIRNSRALAAWRRNDLETAEAEYRAALARLRESGQEEGLGAVLNGLGAVLNRRGDPEGARTSLLEALEVNRRLDRPGPMADSLVALAAGARAQGDEPRAYDWYQDALEARRGGGDRAGEGWVLFRLAEVSSGAGRASERTRGFLGDALEIAREVGDAELEKACRGLQDTGSSIGAR